MLNLKPLFLVLACALAAAPPPTVPAPPLEAGEALALAGPDGIARGYGDASRESPMGTMAKLIWVKLEGAEWGAAAVGFKCAGTWEGMACTSGQAHGRVDLGRALALDCNLAFLAWARTSARIWQRDYGDGPARARLEDVFGPFLGRRLPAGEDVPLLDGAWMGEGELLRASPESLLAWLMDPSQDEVVRRTRRLLLSFVGEVVKPGGWWILAGPGAVTGQPGATCGWAAGSNGSLLAVLRLPKGTGKAEALARFKAIMRVQPPAKETRGR
jgi:hypothetical protein